MFYEKDIYITFFTKLIRFSLSRWCVGDGACVASTQADCGKVWLKKLSNLKFNKKKDKKRFFFDFKLWLKKSKP